MNTIKELQISNKRALRNFKTLGDDSTKKRIFVHYIYYTDSTGLIEFKTYCKKKKLRIKQTKIVDGFTNTKTRLLQVTSYNTASLDEINKITAGLLTTAIRLNLHYDGWETGIKTK